jgi:hypothetical protein
MLQGLLMAHSSTSYRPKWKSGKTAVIRVPQKLVPALLHYARELDQSSTPADLPHPALAANSPHSLAHRPRPSASPCKAKLRCDIRATFAAAFKSWRLRENIPLKQLAADLGLAPATISAWELGRRFPTDRHFELLLDYTALPPCRLFCVMADKCVPLECLLGLSPKS